MSGLPSRGLALTGTVWPGGAAAPVRDGVVVLDGAGRVAATGPAGSVPLPEGLPRLGGPGCWVGPGVVDAHVHLAFSSPEEELRGGLVGVRDLGAPPAAAWRWRTDGPVPAGSPRVAVAGPLLTAPGGYPSRSWGAAGFARFVDSPAAATATVRELASDGADLVKVALEPSGGQPVPSPADLLAIVDAAHQVGLAVSAHALGVAMVARALDAGVDELAHTPTESLPPALVERIATAGVPVVSTLQTLSAAAATMANASAVVAAGGVLVYGTDLGNAGTSPGVDPRELDRLAEAGLGRLGALRAATEGSAARTPGCGSGRLEVGVPADLVLLKRDPLEHPGTWREPLALVVAGRLTRLR